MLREVLNQDLEKRYGREDSLPLDADGCRGCSYCCENVGTSIVLDPYDMASLSRHMGKSYEELLTEKYLELHIVEGLMLPNLQMKENGCSFLNEEKRCGIHESRPGFCRLFPLARVYQGEGFSYILQSGQCQKELKGERRISEWIGLPEMGRYEGFVKSWHDFRKELSESILGMSMRSQKMLGSYILRKFYQSPWNGDFYSLYEERLQTAKEAVKKLQK